VDKWKLIAEDHILHILQFRQLQMSVAGDSVDIDALMEGADRGLLMAVVQNAEHAIKRRYIHTYIKRSSIS